jgi:hypothetical protein
MARMVGGWDMISDGVGKRERRAMISDGEKEGTEGYDQGWRERGDGWL